MSERDLIEGLNDSLSIDELLTVPENQGLVEQNARLARLRGEPGSQERSIRAPNLGKGSWYSQLPEHGWVDREDRPGSNALGVPDEKQGIALPSRATLGQWFDVTFPDGSTHRLQQTDVGPAKWTGKGIDISAAAAHQAGYTPKNFPTGGEFAWAPADGSAPETSEARGVPDTGRRQMAEPRGILDLMGMTGSQPGQQPTGLLGMLGDPETMSYLAMMLKGANPHSQLDPAAMLTNAQALSMRKAAQAQQLAEQARDNARADKALGLRESEYGLARTERQERADAAFEERQQKRDLIAEQKKIDDEVRRNLGGGGPREEGTATTVPEGTRSAEEQIDHYNRELAKNPSPSIARSLERRIEQLQKGPSATTIKSIEKAENEIAPLQATKDKLDRMQSLLPNTLEGPLAGWAGTIGGRAGYFGSQQAKDTLEFNNLAEIETIRDMSRTMKGSTAVKEMDVWLRKAADPTLPKQIRQDNLKMATDAVNREIAVRADRVKQLQEGTYGRKQAPPKKTEDEATGGGTDMGGGWTVREK